MNNIDFLRRILPDRSLVQGSASYFFFALNGKQPIQKYCQDIEQVAKYAQTYSDAGANSYTALALFGDGKNGRKQDNVKYLKVFRCDIDCGKTDADGNLRSDCYPSAKEGMDALASFIGDTGLVPSIIVSSGMGLHVYWVMKQAIDLANWVKGAQYLLQIFRKQGLLVDAPKTTGPEAVLRVPGTKHIKSGNIVSVLKDTGIDYDIADFLDGMIRYLPPSELPRIPACSPPSSSKVSLGDWGEPLHSTAKGVIANCAQIRSMGVGSYNQWFYGMSVLRRFEDGNFWAHELSKEDPRYDYSDTERRFYEAAEDMPARCDTFFTVNPAGCAQCRYRNRVKTPVQLYNSREVRTDGDGAISSIYVSSDAAARSADSSAIQAPEHDEREAGPSRQLLETSVDDTDGFEEEEVSNDNAAENLCDNSRTDTGDVLCDNAPLLGVRPLRRLTIPDKFDYPLLALDSEEFTVDSRGITWHKLEKQRDGGFDVRDILLTESQLYYKYAVHLYVDGRPERGHMFTAVLPTGYTQDIRLDINSDMSDTGLRKWFANANIFMTPEISGTKSEGAVLLRLINTYLSSIIKSKEHKELTTFTEFGWTQIPDKDNPSERHTGFVVGKGVITKDGMEDAHYDDRIEAYAKKELTTKGTLEKWKEGVNLYKELNQMIGQLSVVLSLGSPFLKEGIGEAQSALLSIWSAKSGMGKSHILRYASSVWGDPSKSFVSRMASVSLRGFKLGKFRHIPVFFDEMTDVSDNDMYGLAYTLTGGKEKDKMHSSGAHRIETGSWATASFLTSNRSFKAVIAKKAGDSDATVRRVMEYECDLQDFSGDPEKIRYIDHCTNLIEENYGLAGPEFIYQMLQHEDWIATLHSQVVNWVVKYGFTNDERFMSAPLAVCMITGRWAKALGIIDYDMDALEKWVLRYFVPHNRKFSAENTTSHEEFLAAYLNERMLNTLVVSAARRGADETDPGERDAPDGYIHSMPPRDIFVRYEMAEGRVIISRRDLSDWCIKNHASLSTLLARLTKAGVAFDETVRRLGGGISWLADAKQRVIIIQNEELNKLGIDMDVEGDY